MNRGLDDAGVIAFMIASETLPVLSLPLLLLLLISLVLSCSCFFDFTALLMTTRSTEERPTWGDTTTSLVVNMSSVGAEVRLLPPVG